MRNKIPAFGRVVVMVICDALIAVSLHFSLARGDTPSTKYKTRPTKASQKTIFKKLKNPPPVRPEGVLGGSSVFERGQASGLDQLKYRLPFEYESNVGAGSWASEEHSSFRWKA
jgi:hypothetical protein